MTKRIRVIKKSSRSFFDMGERLSELLKKEERKPTKVNKKKLCEDCTYNDDLSDALRCKLNSASCINDSSRPNFTKIEDEGEND